MGTTVWIQIPLETFVFRIQKSLGLSFFSRLAYGNKPTQGLSLQKVQGSLYDTNPNNPLSKGKSLKIIVHLHQVWFHLMTPYRIPMGKITNSFSNGSNRKPISWGTSGCTVQNFKEKFNSLPWVRAMWWGDGDQGFLWMVISDGVVKNKKMYIHIIYV